jgi:hypothetical protein
VCRHHLRRRSFRQFASRVLKPSSAGRPRNVWEFLVLRRSSRFDRAFYLRGTPDVASAGMRPVIYYIEHGAKAGLDPSHSLKTQAYFAEHWELRGSSFNPLYRHVRLRWRHSDGSS